MYSITVAAVALGVDKRTVDSLVAAAGLAAASPGRRGRNRYINADSIELFALALLLRRDFAIPLPHAVALAKTISAAEGATIRVGTLFILSFDRDRLRDVLRHATADAEAATHVPVRGRPPRKEARGAL
ncbi:MAG: hypothetical protein IT356_02770 [Gemmatimonadaceae bacterium]|nr:hypothetical protein [Gemmatimonadaceae bacterium]